MDEQFIVELAEDGVYIGTENSSGATYDLPSTDLPTVKRTLIEAFEDYINTQWDGGGYV